MDKVMDIAAAMEEILNDEENKKIFSRADMVEHPVKMASDQTPEEFVSDAVSKLLSASEKLDDLGLDKSAEMVLKAAETLIAEAQKEKEEEAEDGDSEKEKKLKEVVDKKVEEDFEGTDPSKEVPPTKK